MNTHKKEPKSLQVKDRGQESRFISRYGDREINSEETLHAITQMTNDAIIMMDNRGIISFWNHAAERIFGYTASEALGEELHILLGSERFYEVYKQGFNRFIKNGKGKAVGKTLELTAKKKNGREFPIELSLSAVRIEDEWHTMSIIRDISEKKKSEEELNRYGQQLDEMVEERTAELEEINKKLIEEINEKRIAEDDLAYLASITENSHDAIASLNMDGQFTSWNKGAEKMFGFTKEEMIGDSFGCIVPQEQKHTCVDFLLTTDERGFVEGAETIRTTKDGIDIPVEITLTALYAKDGEQIGYTYIMRDISDRKIMEEELYKRQEALIQMADEMECKNIELEKTNNLKDLFTDIMRHDLLNPAGIIRSYSEFVLEDYPDHPGEADLGLILKNAKKLIKMIENASAFSKLESADEIELTDHNLKDILIDVCDGLKPAFKSADMEIICKISNDMPLKANGMIEDVFLNFMSNAIKYAPEGKRVILDAKEIDDKYRVSITDFGAGIPDEHKEGIFDRFSRASKGAVKGTGLGLAIVTRLIDLHHGKVWVEDNPKGGSVFIVEIPKS